MISRNWSNWKTPIAAVAALVGVQDPAAVSAQAPPAALVTPVLVRPATSLRADCRPTTSNCVDGSWRLRRLDQSTTTLGEFRGKVVFLHIWATWCAVCRPELESIERLRRTLSASREGREVAFVLVSPENDRVVSRYVRAHALAEWVYTEASAAPSALGIRTVPTTLIVDRTGVVVARHDGRGTWDTPAIVTALISLTAIPRVDSAR